jgi:deoxyribodipyrimidine photolyase-related protein
VNTILVLGDQLNRRIGALAAASPDQSRVLMIESAAMIRGRPFHKQRVHLVLTAMRRFASQLEKMGFAVDYRQAASLTAGISDHTATSQPDEIIVTEPNSRSVDSLVRKLGLRVVASNQFLCHRNDFADWAGDSSRLRMEDFYRWQRRRLDYLMDGDEPAGGKWNFDHDNREPPPPDGDLWPDPTVTRLDELDAAVVEGLPGDLPGDDPVGWWATTRRGALARLHHFIDDVLPTFGPYEDAMLATNWHLAHSLLSPYLNLGLILPQELCDQVEEAYRKGRVPINSAEGVIRQVIGWREFVWGVSWLWPDQGDANVLDNQRSLPPSWTGDADTDLRCLQITLDGVKERGWVHHIQRLMVLANFANLYGIAPSEVSGWMRERFVDGADWVMGPNVMGMGLWADGGRMSTKPYVSGGAYINRMSDYCGSCRFDPRQRTGPDACPFTTLYWDFLDRNRDVLRSNTRMARQYATLDRLADKDALRTRAAEIIEAHGAGDI